MQSMQLKKEGAGQGRAEQKRGVVSDAFSLNYRSEMDIRSHSLCLNGWALMLTSFRER